MDSQIKLDNIIKAENYLNQREISLARFYYKQARIEDANSVYVWAKELETAVLTGKETYSLKLISEMKLRFPNEYYPWHIEYIILAGKDEAEVDRLLHDAELLFLQDTNFQYDKFIFYSGTERYMDAIKIAENYLLEDNKMIIKVADELADIYMILGDGDKAEAIIKRALSIENNMLFSVKLIQYEMLKGNIDEAKKICMEIQDDQEDIIIMMLKKVVLAYFTDEYAEKKVLLDEVIMFCKESTLSYPYRMCLDLLCAISYYIKGDDKSALKMIDYINTLTDNSINEISKLKNLIADKQSESCNEERKTFNAYIWESVLKLYVEYRDGGM